MDKIVLPTPKTAKPPVIQRKVVQNWLEGTVSAFDEARTPLEGLRSSGNVILEQDGTVRPRPSLLSYGTTPTGTILGEIFEFKAVTGLTSLNWLITLQNVAGTTKAYISKDGGAWTVCNGKTYDNTASAHFCQIQNKVLILNGVDTLSYLDIPTSAVIPFTALTTPSAPTLTTNTGLTGTTFNITYRVTANSSVGETDASSALSTPVSTDRDLWAPATQSIKIAWSAVASAVSYNVYMGTVAGFEYLISQGISGLSFTDNGTAAQDVRRLFPTTNSTAGPKVSRGTVISGRVFLVGDADQPYYVRFGGDFGFELDFSPANGGGFTPIGQGTKETPIKVAPFRDGKGNSQITVLCQGASGKGKRYLLTPDSITIGTTVITFYDVIEDNGQEGTDSPDGVIIYHDSIYYPSRDGFKTTGTQPQLQNVLSTNRISNTIQRDIKTLNGSTMNKAVGLGFEGRLYWGLPVGTTNNSEIWVLDLDRNGAWMKPWNVACDWMMLYNDNSGITHFIILQNNKLLEFSFSYAYLTNDNGVAFTTSGQSGLIKFSDDGREWGHIIQVIFTLLRPQGLMNFTISGKTEDAALVTVGTTTFTPTGALAGWGEAGWGVNGWDQFDVVPVTFGDTSQDVIVEVDEECQWWEYAWNSVNANTDYSLSQVICEFSPVGIKDLS